MTDLEKMREWLETYAGHNILSDFRVDFTDQIPNNGGIFPNGLVEVDRRSTICGLTTVTNQYNFGLYYIFEKAPGDDTGAAVNADWVMDFQRWIQEQSVIGLAPIFGDDPKKEKIMAQNGTMYETDEEGTAMYMVQLSAQFTKKFEVKNPWLN